MAHLLVSEPASSISQDIIPSKKPPLSILYRHWSHPRTIYSWTWRQHPEEKPPKQPPYMQNKGIIVAVDVNRERLFATENNVERCGVINTSIHHLDALDLPDKMAFNKDTSGRPMLRVTMSRINIGSTVEQKKTSYATQSYKED